MAYVVDLEDDYAESDIPTTLIRSKADCPSLEVCALNSMPLCFWGTDIVKECQPSRKICFTNCFFVVIIISVFMSTSIVTRFWQFVYVGYGDQR